MITKKPREFILKLTEVEAESIALRLKMNHNTSLSLILYANPLHLLDKTVSDLNNFFLKTNHHVLAGFFTGNRVIKF